MQRSTSQRQVLLAVLKCFKKFPSAYITQQCTRNNIFLFLLSNKNDHKGSKRVHFFEDFITSNKLLLMNQAQVHVAVHLRPVTFTCILLSLLF